jgi:hypothetical protein
MIAIAQALFLFVAGIRKAEAGLSSGLFVLRQTGLSTLIGRRPGLSRNSPHHPRLPSNGQQIAVLRKDRHGAVEHALAHA